MHLRMTTLTTLAGLLLLAPGASAGPRFTTPVRLGGAPSGGEPSIAASPQGLVMVAGPQGIPSGLAGHAGTGLWVSKNDGTSFGPGRYIGSLLGGGDDDIIFDRGIWYTGDLEAAATEVCQSRDSGKTWTGAGPLPDPSNCTTVNAGQAGFSDDRPWLTADPTNPKRIYLTYHEFVSAQPLSFVTNNGGGDDFTNPCGPLVTDPAIEQNVPTDISGGTLVARPAIDKKGNLYVLFATTTQQENAAAFAQGNPSGTFSQLYLAVSKDHCQSFTDYTVFDGQKKYGMNTVQFGDIFNDLAIDGAGNLYAVGVGFIGHKQFASAANVYVLSSKDHGQHWSAPQKLHTPNAADMLPAAVGGPKAGRLVIGYYRTFNGVTDPASLKGRWAYSTAESRNATAARPRYVYADVRRGYSYHNGQICNAGILCGLPGEPSDRSLADFTSVTLDSHSCPLFTFAGEPKGTPSTNGTHTKNYVTRQLTGCLNEPVTHPIGPSQPGGSTQHHKHTQSHHHRKHRRPSRRPKRKRSRGFTG
jgi:hypothetical protein